MGNLFDGSDEDFQVNLGKNFNSLMYAKNTANAVGGGIKSMYEVPTTIATGLAGQTVGALGGLATMKAPDRDESGAYIKGTGRGIDHVVKSIEAGAEKMTVMPRSEVGQNALVAAGEGMQKVGDALLPAREWLEAKAVEMGIPTEVAAAIWTVGIVGAETLSPSKFVPKGALLKFAKEASAFKAKLAKDTGVDINALGPIFDDVKPNVPQKALPAFKTDVADNALLDSEFAVKALEPDVRAQGAAAVGAGRGDKQRGSIKVTDDDIKGVNALETVASRSVLTDYPTLSQDIKNLWEMFDGDPSKVRERIMSAPITMDAQQKLITELTTLVDTQPSKKRSAAEYKKEWDEWQEEWKTEEWTDADLEEYIEFHIADEGSVEGVAKWAEEMLDPPRSDVVDRIRNWKNQRGSVKTIDDDTKGVNALKTAGGRGAVEKISPASADVVASQSRADELMSEVSRLDRVLDAFEDGIPGIGRRVQTGQRPSVDDVRKALESKSFTGDIPNIKIDGQEMSIRNPNDAVRLYEQALNQRNAADKEFGAVMNAISSGKERVSRTADNALKRDKP